MQKEKSNLEALRRAVSGLRDLVWPMESGTVRVQYRPLSAAEGARVNEIAMAAVPPMKARPATVPGLTDEDQPRDEVYDLRDPEFLANSRRLQAEARALALYLAVPVIREGVPRELRAAEGGVSPAALRAWIESPEEAGGLGFPEPFLEALYRAVMGLSRRDAADETGLAGFFSKAASATS